MKNSIVQIETGNILRPNDLFGLKQGVLPNNEKSELQKKQIDEGFVR